MFSEFCVKKFTILSHVFLMTLFMTFATPQKYAIQTSSDGENSFALCLLLHNTSPDSKMYWLADCSGCNPKKSPQEASSWKS